MVCDDIQPACSIPDGALPHLCASSPGFVIDSAYVGDGDCDCPLCEDEEFTCEDCGACPVICGDYVICDFGASPELVTFLNRFSAEQKQQSRQSCSVLDTLLLDMFGFFCFLSPFHSSDHCSVSEASQVHLTLSQPTTTV